jgi:flagellar hook-associated protein 1 FlgK
MATFGGIFSVVRSAIAANQAAMQVTSQNIANAETEGYSRQRAEFTPREPLVMPYGSLGMGVDITNVTRARDAALDSTFRRETGSAESFSVRSDFLRRLEDVLNEPSDSGLSATLDQFWNSWSDLANNPTSGSARSVLRQQGASVASMFRTITRQMDDLETTAREHLRQAVSQVNGQLRAVADLNGQIKAAESAGKEAPDLRDTRDKLLDSLAGLGVSRAEVQADGTVSVYIANLALVSGPAFKALEVRGAPGTLALGVVGDPDPTYSSVGAMGALMDFVNADLQSFRGQLDALARAVVNGVNEYHASGWTAAGELLGGSNWNALTPPTGSRVNFFDPAGATAATISLSGAVAADLNVIAAGDVQNAPGNAAIAQAIAALRDSSGMQALSARMGAAFATAIGIPATSSFAESYRDAVATVGLDAMRAGEAHNVHATLAANADQRRLSVSGVSIDEELTKLMQYQQSYVAATRVVQTIDEMADALLSMV